MSKKTTEQAALSELREMERQFPGDPAPEPEPVEKPGHKGDPGNVWNIPTAPKTETLLIPLDPNGNSDTVYLCVNGKNMLVKRGEPVTLPAEFAEAYRNAQAQQLAALRAQREAMSKE